jgi:hypothetical protein
MASMNLKSLPFHLKNFGVPDGVASVDRAVTVMGQNKINHYHACVIIINVSIKIMLIMMDITHLLLIYVYMYKNGYSKILALASNL